MALEALIEKSHFLSQAHECECECSIKSDMCKMYDIIINIRQYHKTAK